MKFNNEDRQVFENLEEYLLKIYDTDDNEEEKCKLNYALNFIKRMIIEFCKKRGYNIVGNECYDNDSLLKEIIDVSTDSEEKILANFNPALYKEPEKLNNYFHLIIKNLSWEDLQHLAMSFGWINDGFRSFFAEHFEKLLNLASKLYYELNTSEEDDIFAKISILDNENDDDWVEDEDKDFKTNKMVLEPDEFGEWASDDEWLNELDNSTTNNTSNEIKLDEETLIYYVKYINAINELIKYRKIGLNIINKLYELSRQKKLEEFYSDEEFSSMFNQIIEHDTTYCSYYFHGTQCLKDAQTIIEEGLGMIRNDLNSTSYRELTKEEVILYERGFGGEIGRDAIIIIEVPKNNNGKELNVVTQLDDKTKIHFVPSGLQGLDRKPSYIVLPENIVGYVDKRNKKIIFNPKYRNYEKFIDIKKSR